MLRQSSARALLGAVTAGALGAGLLVAAPPAAAIEKHHEWGRLSAADGVLRKGCQRITYRYDLTPPEGDWAVETFLVGPGGKRLGSDGLLSGYNELSGTKSFRICRTSTRPGRFRIRGLLSVQNGPFDYSEGWIKAASFKMKKKKR